MYPNGDVRGDLSRARVGHGDMPTLGWHALCLLPVDQCRCHGGESHSIEAHDVIAAELVACALGVRRRPELQVSPFARLAAVLARSVESIARAFGKPATRDGYTVAR